MDTAIETIMMVALALSLALATPTTQTTTEAVTTTEEAVTTVAVTPATELPDGMWKIETENLSEREEPGYAIKVSPELRGEVAYANCIVFCEFEDSKYDAFCLKVKNVKLDDNGEFFVKASECVEVMSVEGRYEPVFTEIDENGNKSISYVMMTSGDAKTMTGIVDLELSEDGKSYKVTSIHPNYEMEENMKDDEEFNYDDIVSMNMLLGDFEVTYDEYGYAEPTDKWNSDGDSIFYVDPQHPGYDMDIRPFEPSEYDTGMYAIFTVVDRNGNAHMSPRVNLKE